MPCYWYRLGSLRYTAPEHLWGRTDPSKMGDVYSLAMVSFEVRSSVVNHPEPLDTITPFGQVLTGILPYDYSDRDNIAKRIGRGVRPSRPADRRRNQWLQDPVWDMITTDWSHELEQRCELSVMHHVFLTSSQEDVRNVELGDSSIQNNGNITVAESFRTFGQSGSTAVEGSSHGSPPFSSFCEIQTRN